MGFTEELAGLLQGRPNGQCQPRRAVLTHTCVLFLDKGEQGEAQKDSLLFKEPDGLEQ
jgi:hypothetical protein